MVIVEMQKNDEKKMIALKFKCNKSEDHETLDAIRTAMMGDFEKRGAYLNSNEFVVQVKLDETEG